MKPWWIIPLRVSLATLVLLGLALPIVSVSAQTEHESDIKTLQVSLWPDYDRPAMLVIYHITFDVHETYPLRVELRIPSEASKPVQVSFEGWDNMLYNLEYQSIAGDEWNTIVFSTPYPTVQVEYYDPVQEQTGTQRSYQYNWPGDYAVDDFQVQVMQPSNATNLEIIPSLGGEMQDDEGIQFYNASIGQVNAGDDFSITIRYQALTNVLQAPLLPVSADQEITLSNINGRWSAQNIFPYLLGNRGGLILITGIFISVMVMVVAVLLISGYWRPRVMQRKQVLERKGGSDGPPIYCYQCGKKARSGDIYCRSCGAKYPYS